MSETEVRFIELLRVPITQEEIKQTLKELTKTMEEIKTNPVTNWPQAKRLEKAIKALETLS